MLYPETNSDSPSTKSNGARCNSAWAEIIQIIKINGINNNKENEFFIEKKSKELKYKIGDSIIKLIATSYEIVWAIARMAPNKAYLEFLDHPAIRVV